MDQFQRHLLERPRHKRVWSHWSTGSQAAALLLGNPASHIHHVYIQSDEWALEAEIARRQVALKKRGHQPNDEVILAMSERLWLLRESLEAKIKSGARELLVVHDGALRHKPADETARRSARFEQSFEFAARSLKVWADAGQLDLEVLNTHWSRPGDPHKDTLVRYVRNAYPETFGRD
ncbi:hypothetical protein GCM10009851_33050 [Herbiconiux moechotypicola]|uniref:Class I SAM-dependent methyltransferase n=2 Tax=Herbiconiux moechotypicola TaxID=637393 RepID=A0ABP5QVE4_9MICO